jgi:hypothetical protein
MKHYLRLSLVSFFLFSFLSPCFAAEERPLRYTFVPRDQSKPGDYKVVTVPAITLRQAKIDAQTYHIGWDAVDSWMGQSCVMYNVLLKKRPPHVPGTQPIPRPIPKR